TGWRDAAAAAEHGGGNGPRRIGTTQRTSRGASSPARLFARLLHPMHRTLKSAGHCLRRLRTDAAPNAQTAPPNRLPRRQHVCDKAERVLPESAVNERFKERQ